MNSPEPFDTFAQPWPTRDALQITAVRTCVTSPEGIPLVTVIVETSDAGLVGYGCATFTQRWRSVVTFVEEYLAPLVIGRHPADIEDLVRLVKLTAYWREGPVGNNAIAGLDLALWDIAGKRAGMPVHELLGGRVRSAVETYTHAGAGTIEETLELAESFVAQGWRHVRLQLGQPGIGTYGAPWTREITAVNAPYPRGWRVSEYLNLAPQLFAQARERLGADVALLHDVHSRLSPKEALILGSRLEPFGLFFLEDILAPEYWDRLPDVTPHIPVPVAVGELVTSITDAYRLVLEGGVDFIRCHITAIGGLTPARKVAALAEARGVRTAWHSPGDIAPFGVAANVAIDVNSPAFGIQECHVYNEATHEIFPGTLDVVNGWLTPNDAPGWGIGLDEKAAARFAPENSQHDRWAAGNRALDGALIYP